MKSFVQQLGGRVMGVLSGFDRLLIRGILRCVIDARGMTGHLSGAGVKLTDFKPSAQQCSRFVKESSLQVARDQGRAVRSLPGSAEQKKEVAREMAERDQIRDGLIGVLTAVEPCVSFPVRRDREQQKIERERAPRKCLHLDHDFDHPRFGLCTCGCRRGSPSPFRSASTGTSGCAVN